MDKEGLANALYEVAARITGAQALLEVRDDFDGDEALNFTDRLLRDAYQRTIAAAEEVESLEPARAT